MTTRLPGPFLVHHIEEIGYRVITASSETEALRLARQFLPDLITLDLMTPGMSGKELFHHIVASDQKTAEKVIFITGDTSDGHTRDFISGLNNPVVLKPFQLDDICRQVQKMVEAN